MLCVERLPSSSPNAPTLCCAISPSVHGILARPPGATPSAILSARQLARPQFHTFPNGRSRSRSTYPLQSPNSSRHSFCYERPQHPAPTQRHCHDLLVHNRKSRKRRSRMKNTASFPRSRKKMSRSAYHLISLQPHSPPQPHISQPCIVPSGPPLAILSVQLCRCTNSSLFSHVTDNDNDQSGPNSPQFMCSPIHRSTKHTASPHSPTNKK